jgi:choline dehydrogenase
MVIWSLLRPDAPSPLSTESSVMARLALRRGAPDVSLSLADSIAIPDMPGIGPVLGKRASVGVAATLLNPVSRGAVHIRREQPTGPPEIALGLGGAGHDLDRLMDATRLAWSVVRSAPFRDLLDRTLLWTERMTADPALLRAAVPRFVSPMWHPVGTARMGPEGDPGAVVDPYCRVHRVRGLRVVDASVMPTIPSATPNLTCIMIAERVAAWMASADC